MHHFSDDMEIDTTKTRDLLEQAKTNIILAQRRQKKVYDTKHSNPCVFQIGALVLKKDFTRKKRKGGKLDSKWVGPYKIVATLGRGLFHLQDVSDPDKMIARVNGVHLKEYRMPNSSKVCCVQGLIEPCCEHPWTVHYLIPHYYLS